MSGDFEYDLDEALRGIDTAEVMSVFFPTLRRAVVIDTRHDDKTGPMVIVLPMVASPEERLRSIRRLRPNLPQVNSLTLIPWPRYVASLVRLGVWGRIVKRFEGSGHTEAVAACESALAELERLEKAELAAVVRGENYHTIWSVRQ